MSTDEQMVVPAGDGWFVTTVWDDTEEGAETSRVAAWTQTGRAWALDDSGSLEVVDWAHSETWCLLPGDDFTQRVAEVKARLRDRWEVTEADLRYTQMKKGERPPSGRVTTADVIEHDGVQSIVVTTDSGESITLRFSFESTDVMKSTLANLKLLGISAHEHLAVAPTVPQLAAMLVGRDVA